MPTITTRRVLLIVALAWCVRLTLAQPTTSSAPALAYVRGEPRAAEKRWDGLPGLEHPRVAATLETRPALAEPPDGRKMNIPREIIKSALASVFGSQRPMGPVTTGGRDREADAFYVLKTGAGIERTAVFVGEERVADRWTVYAGSDDEAQALVEALLRAFPQVVAAELEPARQKFAQASERVDATNRTIVDCEQQIQQREHACRNAGVAEMTDEAIDGAIARFNQEQRLNQVDIAGIEASLASAKQRGGTGELSPTLARIQVELEIQLVGKLARKEALTQELQALQRGRTERRHIRELEKKLAEANTWLERYGQRIRAMCADEVAALEDVARVTVVDDRVEISPIVAPGAP
ncbi:MAG TPA: hypothetical protein PLQ87_00340 [Phycisphaerae bacterium]|nr:hypothetical protein [Phycisphaerae bacterium]